MRQDGCIRKLGGELQIKHVKFVNSSLHVQSVNKYLIICTFHLRTNLYIVLQNKINKFCYIYQSFDVMKTSSRLIFPSLNTSVRVSPISSSFRYASAQSMCLQPQCKASFTAFPTSPFLDFHVLQKEMKISFSYQRQVQDKKPSRIFIF